MSSICIPPFKCVQLQDCPGGCCFTLLSGKDIALCNGRLGLWAIKPKEEFQLTHCSFALCWGCLRNAQEKNSLFFSTLMEWIHSFWDAIGFLFTHVYTQNCYKRVTDIHIFKRCKEDYSKSTEKMEITMRGTINVNRPERNKNPKEKWKQPGEKVVICHPPSLAVHFPFLFRSSMK